MNVALLIHGKKPKAMRMGRRIQQLCQGRAIQSFISSGPNQMVGLCHKALDLGFNHLVFIGGDGWCSEGVDALCRYYRKQNSDARSPDLGYDWAAIKQIPVAFLPAGSGNDLVKSLDNKESVESLWHRLQNVDRLETTQMDIGSLTFTNEIGGSTERFFINIADVGMASAAMKRRETLPHWLGSMLRYYGAILSTVGSYASKKCSISVDGIEWEGEISNIVVANGRYFGHGLCVAPNARLCDGILDVIILPPFTVLDLLKQFRNLKTRKPLTHPGVKILRGTHVEIQCSPSDKEYTPLDRSTQIELEADGDFIGFTPVHIECLSQRLTIF